MTTIDKLPQPIRESVEFYVERRRKMLEKGKGETALQLQGRIEGLLEAMHHLNIIDYSDYCEIKDTYNLKMWNQMHKEE